MAINKRDTSLSSSRPPTAPRRIVINKIVAARIASGIGVLGIVIAVLALILQKSLTPVVFVSTLVGVGGLIAWTMLAPDDLRAMLTGRGLAYGSNSVVSTILVIGIVTIGYTLTANSGVAADFTTVGYYSLKSDVKNVVVNLTRPIQITAFYNPSQIVNRDLDMPVLRMFADASPDKIKLVVADPDEQPTLAKSLGLIGASGVFVSYLTDTGSPDPAYTVQSKGDYAREPWIAEAIKQLDARGKYRILFTTGHDEIETSIEARGDASNIRAGAESVGIATGTIDLRTQDIPAGTSALIVIRPQRDFEQAEVNKVAAYLANGGKLLIMAKPAYMSVFQFMTTPESPMSQYLWQNWGIRAQNDIVFDPTSYVVDPFRVLASQVSIHPVMKRDSANTTSIQPLLTLVQSWEIAQTPPTDVEITPLIYSSVKSVGKRDLRAVASNPSAASNLQKQDGDLSGPLVLAAAIENTKSQSRIIVIGDADWVYNEAITTYDGALLWTNMVDWLTSYISNISVEPKIRELPFTADTASLNISVLITLVILPGIILFVGGLVWWDRLRRQ